MDIASIPTKRLEAAMDQLPNADMRRLVELRYVRGLRDREIQKPIYNAKRSVPTPTS